MPVLLNVFWLSAEDPAPYLGQELFFRIFQGYSIVQAGCGKLRNDWKRQNKLKKVVDKQS